MPRKSSDGRWLVDIRPYGANGPRIRKKFDTKSEATRFEAFTLNKAIHEPWNPARTDTRKLSELTHLWFEHHGIHLVAGQSHRNIVLEFARFTRDKQARLITPDDWFRYRAKKLQEGMKESTLNIYLIRVKTLFNKLRKTEVISYDNPLVNVEPFRLQEEEKSFLTKPEIDTLLSNLRRDDHTLYMMALVCLSTGARWQEANRLTKQDLIGNMIQYKQTKSKRIRKIPVSPGLKKLLSEWLNTHEPSSEYRRQFTALLSEYGLKKRDYQSTHILRHSFAAHFVMNGGHLMSLKNILGHAKIETTMWYAHLSPSHLEEAVTLNPVDI